MEEEGEFRRVETLRREGKNCKTYKLEKCGVVVFWGREPALDVFFNVKSKFAQSPLEDLVRLGVGY